MAPLLFSKEIIINLFPLAPISYLQRTLAKNFSQVVSTLKLNWGLKRKGGNHYEEISDISIVCINAL